MGQELGLNVAVSNTAKEYAVKKLPPDPALFSDKVKEPAAEGELRQSALRWEELETGEGRREPRLAVDTVKIGPTSVVTPEAVRAAVPLHDLRRDLRKKFTLLFESIYANCFSHNRLIARVAEWMVGTILERLALLGMSPAELGAIRKEVRTDLIIQNETALSQVFYDETMLEIVA